MVRVGVGPGSWSRSLSVDVHNPHAKQQYHTLSQWDDTSGRDRQSWSGVMVMGSWSLSVSAIVILTLSNNITSYSSGMIRPEGIVEVGLGPWSRGHVWSRVNVQVIEFVDSINPHIKQRNNPPQPKWEGIHLGGTVGVRKGQCMCVVIGILAD